MTVPPLPDTPTLRCAYQMNHDSGLKAGNRFYVRYGGSAPNGANCISIAQALQTLWSAHFQPLINVDWTLVNTDVIDITTLLGASGSYASSDGGADTGTPMYAQQAMNVEFNIAERYRGGKPRMYMPPGADGNQLNDVSWEPSYVASWNSAWNAWATGLAAISVGGVGTLTHTILSYYHGFTNKGGGADRAYNVPTYRTPNALHFDVTGYSAKQEISSQRRRRTSTTY